MQQEHTSLVRDFDFALPQELIAQEPARERSASRMLTVDRGTGALADRAFADLPELLAPGDLLVLNNSRVFPARLFARRAGATGRVEVLLTEQAEPGLWRALVRPGRKVLLGTHLVFPGEGDPLLRAEVVEHGSFGERALRFEPTADFFNIIERIGQIPLPPYIHREAEQRRAEDRERYQTVYADQRGSVAAPTAGLHFTQALLTALQAKGIEIATLTLHVGLGTFQPVRVERVEDIRLHREHYTLPQAAADAVNRARAEARRIVAVGTTTVRTLEHCAQAAHGGPLVAHSGSTCIFISPGFRFQLVDALLTNFHLPQSTLLMLVCAFAGSAPVLAAYRHAVAQRYRFFSYGDCMFLG